MGIKLSTKFKSTTWPHAHIYMSPRVPTYIDTRGCHVDSDRELALSINLGTTKGGTQSCSGENHQLFPKRKDPY